MKISSLVTHPLSLTDFLNYAKSQGYAVVGNEQHWLNEYTEYVQSNKDNSRSNYNGDN